jgi:hypothetical protein
MCQGPVDSLLISFLLSLLNPHDIVIIGFSTPYHLFCLFYLLLPYNVAMRRCIIYWSMHVQICLHFPFTFDCGVCFS